jgi:hypothetical protein
MNDQQRADRLAEALAPAKFVLRRRDGVYVARPGAPSSYTKKLEEALTFSTYDDAERNLCPGNETIEPIEGLFLRFGPRYEPGSIMGDAAREKAARIKGALPPHAHMYAGTCSITASLNLDRVCVPGCEYLDAFWEQHLNIRKMVQTEIKIMRAVGAYR